MGFIFLILATNMSYDSLYPLIFMSSVIVCGIQINIKNKCEADCSAFIQYNIAPSKKFCELKTEEYNYHKRITYLLAKFIGIDRKALIDNRKIKILFCNFWPF